MKRGICKLCLTDADLQDSHYLGRAFYRLLTDGNDRPILVSPTYIKQAQTQITDFLLCESCETRFNKHGENYVMTLVNGRSGFKMLECLRANSVSRPERDLRVYRAADMGINTDALAYFALSIVWRGTHAWPPQKGFAVGGLNLGVHEERIRHYLLGNALFPAGTVVKVSVATDEITQNTVDFPRHSPDQPDATAFTFVALGLVLDVVIGDPLPAYCYDNCCVQSSEKLIYGGDFERFTLWDHLACKQTAVIDRKLAP